MLIPAIFSWEVLTFSMFALVFILFQDSIAGKKLKKGFLYGLSIHDGAAGLDFIFIVWNFAGDSYGNRRNSKK